MGTKHCGHHLQEIIKGQSVHYLLTSVVDQKEAKEKNEMFISRCKWCCALAGSGRAEWLPKKCLAGDAAELSAAWGQKSWSTTHTHARTHTPHSQSTRALAGGASNQVCLVLLTGASAPGRWLPTSGVGVPTGDVAGQVGQWLVRGEKAAQRRGRTTATRLGLVEETLRGWPTAAENAATAAAAAEELTGVLVQSSHWSAPLSARVWAPRVLVESGVVALAENSLLDGLRLEVRILTGTVRHCRCCDIALLAQAFARRHRGHHLPGVLSSEADAGLTHRVVDVLWPPNRTWLPPNAGGSFQSQGVQATH